MLTDWLIVRRLAAELDRALRGKRIRGAGRLADGRFGLAFADGTLSIDAFGPTPIVLFEAAAPLERESGWQRTIADALDGLRVDAIRARRGDRLIALECSSRSRFGVTSGYRLVVELVPRFGNVVLLKDDTVVAAAKEFPRASNALRATVAGEPYEPPPLPAPAGDGASLDGALAANDGAAASRALRAAVPLVPRLVAESFVAEILPFASTTATTTTALAARLLARANALVDATTGTPDGLGDAYAYRDGDVLVQTHVVPLAQFASLRCERAPALLPLLVEAVGGATSRRSRQAFDARRTTLRARVERRRAALARERTTLERERDDAAGRDALRHAGELLYAHLGEVPPGATRFVPPSDPAIDIVLDPELDAKANAAAIFKRYRKATAKLAHTQRRLDELVREERFVAELGWELERAEPETIDDVADSLERIERRRASTVPRERARRQKPFDVRVAGDARIFVGRSPRGNADLTFRIARPGDLWFHARATPGAHVVLQLDTPRRATDDELERAARLAAFHSKARASEKVSVDYTERKHVRRQQNAPPGLVWYTNARTLLVAPDAGDPS